MNAILKSGRKNFSDTFPIKNGSKIKEDPLSPTLLHFTFEYTNRSTTDLHLVRVFFFFLPEAAGCLPFVNTNTL